MDQQAATRAGALLWETWRERRQIDALPNGLPAGDAG